MQARRITYERGWGSGLIVLGVVVLAVVVGVALSIVRNPDTHLDRWLPQDETSGPEASFDWASTDLRVEFTDTSRPGDFAVEEWEWDFGDGDTATEPAPRHEFGEPGEYQVTLRVVDADGSAATAEASVAVEPGANDSGQGGSVLDLTALAGTLTDVLRGVLIVALVAAGLIVLTLVGGRLLLNGVRLLRPVPDRINLKLRPRQLDLAVHDSTREGRDTAPANTTGPPA